MPPGPEPVPDKCPICGTPKNENGEYKFVKLINDIGWQWYCRPCSTGEGFMRARDGGAEK